MATIDHLLLRSKFRGCLLGGLIGDCFGAPYEGEVMTPEGKLQLQKYFDEAENTYKGSVKEYTDDTAMTICVAKCLTDKPVLDYKFMARLFVSEYYSSPNRGYGQNVVDVFRKLRRSRYEDIYKPSQEQFSGMGSYGNGAAMRVSPLALFFHNNTAATFEAVTQASKITHTHKHAINGAILHSLAIQRSLHTDPLSKIDVNQFVYSLTDHMKKIENDGARIGFPQRSYRSKLYRMQCVLNKECLTDSDDDVIKYLGNNVIALDSVGTAIYCFLRAQSEIPGIETDNIFRRTIQYAISLGGDTDTIANMAGSIAGAYVGEEYINENLLSHCEFHKEMLDVADNLFEVLEDADKSV